MNGLTLLLDTLKYVLPSLIVAATAIITVRYFLQRDQKIRLLEAKVNSSRDVTLTRLQAYERMTLLLERIHPQAVFNRVWQSDMTARELQYAFTITIQAEYDHNTAQQIYISADAWNLVTQAKNELIALANSIGNAMPPDFTAAQFSKVYMDTINSEETQLPTATALAFIKQEVAQML